VYHVNIKIKKAKISLLYKIHGLGFLKNTYFSFFLLLLGLWYILKYCCPQDRHHQNMKADMWC